MIYTPRSEQPIWNSVQRFRVWACWKTGVLGVWKVSIFLLLACLSTRLSQVYAYTELPLSYSLPEMPAEKFFREGLFTTVYDSPTTKTLYRTALWLMKLWITQGGWMAFRASWLNMIAIWKTHTHNCAIKNLQWRTTNMIATWTMYYLSLLLQCHGQRTCIHTHR